MRSKEQLQYLIVDGLLAEVDCDIDHTLPWTGEIMLAHRLRAVPRRTIRVHLGLLKTRIPSDRTRWPWPRPARCRCAPPHAHRDAGLASSLFVHYTIGFEVSNPRSRSTEQRVRDAATRLGSTGSPSLPGDRFPGEAVTGQ